MDVRRLTGASQRDERRAAVVRVRLDEPLRDVQVDASRFDDVLLVARFGRTFLGEVFVRSRPVLTAKEIWEALERGLGPELRRAALREMVRRAAGAPAWHGAPANVSVVVCTRDRPDALERCLTSLRHLGSPAEIVVVDNASADPRVEQTARRFPVLYVREPLPGQSRARNTGIGAASGELIAFTDDDCIVEPDWLDDLSRDFADPLVGAVTGYIGPYELDTPAQHIFERHGGFERGVARRVCDPTFLPASVLAGQVGAGANMIFRRSALEAIDGFDEGFGPGTAARSGDDKDAFYRLLMAGHRILYTPDRAVWHVHRDTIDGVRRVFFDYGVSEFAYSLNNFVRRRDTTASLVWLWWLRHFGKEALTHVTRDPERIPLRFLLAEIGGALSAPFALRQARRQRRAIAPVPVGGPAREVGNPSPHPAVEVRGETADGITMAIATRNRRERLQGLLARLARQTLPDDRYEVVVVVDGATDDSAEMARAIDVPFDVRVIEQEHSGLSVTRNRGAAEARHPIVAFFDDDIVPVDGLLESHLAAHRDARRPRAVLGPYPPADLPSHFWGRRQAAWWNDHFRHKAEPGHVWTFIDYVDGNTSLRPRDLEEVGGYDERLRGGRRQDWELGMRLLDAGWEFAHCPGALGRHEFDARLETAFRVGREEGGLDVALARMHPRARDHLPIAWVANWLLCRSNRARRVYPRAVPSPGPTARTMRLLERLERTGNVWLWKTVTDRLLVQAYANGVEEALPDPAERRAFLEWARGPADRAAPIAVDLATSTTIAQVDTGAAVYIDAAWRGRGLGRHRILGPSENWGWDEVVERLAAAVEARGRGGAISEALDSVIPARRGLS